MKERVCLIVEQLGILLYIFPIAFKYKKSEIFMLILFSQKIVFSGSRGDFLVMVWKNIIN